MRDRPLLAGSLVVILAASGFGILGPVARFAYDAGLDPLSFGAWRSIFGATVVAVVVAVRVSRGTPFQAPWRLPGADGAAILTVALASLGLNIAIFSAFGLTSIAIALLAFYTYPAMVAVAAAAIGDERPDRGAILALGLALLGMVLVVGGGIGGSTVTVNPLGVLLGLAAAVGQTVFVILSRNRFRSVASEQAMEWILVVGAVGGSVIAIVAGRPFGVVFSHPTALLFAGIAGTVAAGIPSTMFLVGIRAVGGTRAGILMLVEPLVGVTLAALLLGEALAPIQAVGGAAILVAAVLVQRSTTAKAPADPVTHEPVPVIIEPAGVPGVEQT
jgi:DME family drug/metabolite transporter